MYSYWKEIPSLEQLRYWLNLPDNDNDTAAILENDGHGGGIINASCGDLKCKFGIKIYRHTGYSYSLV